MMVLAIIHRMHQFVHQGVEHFHRVGQHGRNEDLVDAVRGRGSRPALADMVGAHARAGKAARHANLGESMPFGSKEGLEGVDGLVQPGFAKGKGHAAHWALRKAQSQGWNSP